jgi:hypothetical protein
MGREVTLGRYNPAYTLSVKLPKYFVATPQQASDLHINPFALSLLAESYGDHPEQFGDENVVFLARAHNGQEVWFVMTKTKPTKEDFEPESA